MDDNQSKFALTLVMGSIFLSYSLPMIKEAMQAIDAAIHLVGRDCIAPNPKAPNAPSGNGTDDEHQSIDLSLQ